jgi:hypothetical protein
VTAGEPWAGLSLVDGDGKSRNSTNSSVQINSISAICPNKGLLCFTNFQPIENQLSVGCGGTCCNPSTQEAETGEL